MKRNAVEWAVLGTSIVAIVAVVGLLLFEGLSESAPADPRVELRLAEARQASLGWIVPATVFNDGEEAVEAVTLEATATVAGESETSELDIDFLPAGTTVEGAFAFSAQPSGPIDVRVVSYRQP